MDSKAKVRELRAGFVYRCITRKSTKSIVLAAKLNRKYEQLDKADKDTCRLIGDILAGGFDEIEKAVKAQTQESKENGKAEKEAVPGTEEETPPKTETDEDEAQESKEETGNNPEAQSGETQTDA